MSIRILALLLLAATANAQVPDSGISLSLARERAARISNLQYAVRFDIPAGKSERITGSETVSFDLRDTKAPLVLDFGGELLESQPHGDIVNGHIIIARNALKAGHNELRLRFHSSDASLNRNDEYLYTLFVPARASLALPVFDQPDLKARWSLTLEVPHAWQTVANGAQISRIATNDARDVVRFEETKPLPTYLFGFVAGRWFVETAARKIGNRAMTLHMYHRETDSTKVARNRDAIFDLVATALNYMEQYTGIPYPFGKYDFVAVPSFQFGGMEHAGAILYQASSLFLDESATQNQKLGRASLISHETAHMWFGDLVTMKWFNDVWLKEVMANFMADKIVRPSFPGINQPLRFLLAHYPAAYDVDRTAGTHPIRQQLANLNEAAQLYGNIIYEKAPVVMMQLEDLTGADNFRNGMRAYLRAHEYGNATFNDMISALDPLTPEDLRAWSRLWVDEAGRPTVAVRRNPLALIESDPFQRGRHWDEKLNLAFIYGDTVLHVPARLRTTMTSLVAPRRSVPNAIVPNGDGKGYGLFQLDDASRSWLLGNISSLRDPLLRGAVWLDLWDALLEHEVSAASLLDVELEALPLETDEQLTARILGYLPETYWRHLTIAQRNDAAQRVEAVLWDLLAAAPTASRKSAIFSTLRSVALTPQSVAHLRAIWARTDSVPGLKLSEDDYTALAAALAIRDVADSDSILNAQAARITNPDRKARFAFVRPTLSRDSTVRDAWFNALQERANRTHEPWVLEGLSYLNHPLRAQHAVRYIEPALEMLAQVRATGDIFFPKRWLDATLSGHASPRAAAIIRQFLAERPDYPVRLRQIVLQSADPVFRAAETRKP